MLSVVSLSTKYAKITFCTVAYRLIVSEENNMQKSFKKLFIVSFVFAAAIFLNNRFTVFAATPLPLQTDFIEDTEAKIDKLSNFEAAYIFGDKTVTLNGDDTAKWLVTSTNYEHYLKTSNNEKAFLIAGRKSVLPEKYNIENGFITDKNGNLVISLKAMYDSLKNIFDIYNYKAKEGVITFRATSGRIVYFNGIPEQIADVDLDAEFEALASAFANSKDISRQVYDEKKATSKDTNLKTVGSSYIEVDMALQHLYMYIDGRLIIDTPVVTGNMSWGMGTPEGIFPLLGKSRNATLVGEDYRTPVSYWMPFTYRGHGIHDSIWRRNDYGGDTYITNGSHGCVNTPIEAVAVVYEYSYPGIPIVCFY